ncbi:MAG: hypothetical protein ABSH16_00165 [Sedimentisphaerales bacterium]
MDTYNYQTGMQPITAGVSRIGQDVSGGIENVEQAVGEQKIQRANDAQNQQVFGQVKDFFGRVRGVKLDGLEPKPNEPNPQYVERLKQAAPTLVDQLKTAGVDPNELRQAVAIPGFALPDVQKLIYKRTGTQLEQELTAPPAPPADSIADIKAGVLSLDDINRKHRTNISQDEYNRIAGIAEPQPAKPPTLPAGQAGPVQPAPTPQAQAAADQPLPPALAEAQPGLHQPISFQAARERVTAADLPQEQKKEFEPILTGIADREASALVTPGPAPRRRTEFMRDVTGKGIPLTPEVKEAAGGMLSEKDIADEQAKKDALAHKVRYDQMREKEQNNSLLKIMLDQEKFNATMRRAYGKDSVTNLAQLHKALQEYNDLDNQLKIAMNVNQGSLNEKLPQDPAALMDRLQELDGYIQTIKSKLPGIDKQLEKYSSPNRSEPVALPTLAPDEPAPNPIYPQRPKRPLTSFDTP